MTSLSRKKHPTIAPNTRPETADKAHFDCGSQIADCGFASANPKSEIRNPKSLLQIIATVIAFGAFAISVGVAGANELQWRRGGPSVIHATTTPGSATATTVQPRRDAAVAPVAYDAEQAGGGPSFGNEPVSQAALRSVIVRHDNPDSDNDQDSYRSAQRYGEPSAPADSRYDQQLRSPFGDSTPQPGTESQGLKEDTMPLPPAEGAPSELAPPTDNGPNMPESQTPPPSMPQYQQPQNQQPTKPRQSTIPTTPRTFQPQPTTKAPRSAGGHDPFDNGPQTGTGPTQPSPLGAAGGSHLEPEVLQAEQGKAKQFCSDELAREKSNTITTVDLSIAVAGTQGEDYPFECSIDEGTMYSGRCWDQITYMWKASALCHKPLYFEDEGLERYGHSWGPCCDPLISGAHFFCTLPVLPYCMGVTPPNECMYALGHYRPGSCTPYMINPVPLSCRGAVFEAAGVAGTAWFLP
jgi:hypothetical protein